MAETKVNRENMCRWIIDALGTQQMTAREIAVVLHQKGYIPLPIRQATAPRLTELMESRKVEVVGSKLDEESKKTVSIYKVVHTEDGK